MVNAVRCSGGGTGKTGYQLSCDNVATVVTNIQICITHVDCHWSWSDSGGLVDDICKKDDDDEESCWRLCLLTSALILVLTQGLMLTPALRQAALALGTRSSDSSCYIATSGQGSVVTAPSLPPSVKYN